MSKKLLPTILTFLTSAIIILLVQDHVFFWDTVQLGAKHAYWYYENNFQSLLLPTEIDSGHPPLFGMYLAFCWLLFGKSLAGKPLGDAAFFVGKFMDGPAHRRSFGRSTESPGCFPSYYWQIRFLQGKLF